MQKAFKGLTAAYYVAGVAVAVVIILSNLSDMGLMILRLGLWLVTVTAIYALLVSFLDSRKVSLLHQCRPADFIDHANMVFDGLREGLYKNGYRLNLWAAHHDLGEYDKALYYLEQVDTKFPDNAFGMSISFAYRLNRSGLYMELGEVENTQRELENARAILSSPIFPPALKDVCSMDLESQKLQLQMHLGDYRNTEEFYKKKFAADNTQRSKMLSQNNLAEIYLHFGDTAKAAEALHYVIEHGGQTRFVQEAKEKLDKLS